MADENNKSPANKNAQTTQQRPKAAPEKVVVQPYNIEKMKAAGATAMAGFIFAVAQYKKALA